MTLRSSVCPLLLQTLFPIRVPLKSMSAKKTPASCSFSLFHQEYIDHILKQENELEEINVKEPRTEEEKENAASLLELVTVRKIQFLTTFFATKPPYCIGSVNLKIRHYLLIK